MILNFENFERLDEADLTTKITSWISRNFGGKISKINSLANDYEELENEYIDEFESIYTEIDKLQLQKNETKNDPAEKKKLERVIIGNKNVIKAKQGLHYKKTTAIFNKIKDIINNDKTLKLYWEKLKTEIDVEIAETLYNKTKKFIDQSMVDSLYNDYRQAVNIAKEKDIAFKEYYLNDLEKSKDYDKNIEKSYIDDIMNTVKKEYRYDYSHLLGIPNSVFKDELKKYPYDSLSDMREYLNDIKRKAYEDLEYKKKEIKRNSVGEEMEEINRKQKEAFDVQNKIARDIKSKILIIDRYV